TMSERFSFTFAAGFLVSISASIAPPTARAAAISSMDDIQFWVGAGDQRAAMVVDWNDGKQPESLSWGFRWSGSATGKTMLDAIESADPRLTQTPGGGGPGTVYGLGFDTDGDGFAISGT